MRTVNGKFVFLMDELIGKKVLYKRWFGATFEEIAARFDGGKLRAFEHYKGPINSIVWCNLGYIYYHDKQDYLNPGLYEFIDEQCDYFLLEDVERCEAEYPEYIGNITLESLGLEQTQPPKLPEEKPEYIKAHDLRKEFGMSPVQFVGYLREHRDLCFSGNDVDESSRKWFYRHASLEQAAEMLDCFSIHHLDIDHHFAMPTANDEKPAVERSQNENCVKFAAQLAESQENIESLRKWNKFLNEQNKKLMGEVAEKEEQITALENTNNEMGTTVRTQAATEARQVKVLESWQVSFKIMTLVILQCRADGPKKRTKAELQSMCSKHGGGLTSTQLKFLRECLRECLGEDHVNTEGGPSSQGCDPS